MKKNLTFRLGELFCGPGGLALGALNSAFTHKGEKHQIQPTWASDYDSDTCATYLHNIGKSGKELVICKDVRELDISKLPRIDAFAYGFPCNDFSLVGERKGFDGKFGPLYSYGIQVLDYFKPKFFVAENVGGMRSANEGRAFLKILEDLENAGNGYTLTAHYYRFEHYSIPQTRHRVIIVGIEKKLGVKFQVPAPTSLNNLTTAGSALKNIPKNAPNQELTTQSKTVVERLKHIKPGQNVWTANLPPSLKLNVKSAQLSQIYRRLDAKKPSYTITGSGGGGTHGYHWDEPRALTNRERARIQTFPDNFLFKGSKESVRKQIGMAVSPEMSKIIFSSILKCLAGISYKTIPANYEIKQIEPHHELSLA